MSKSGSRILVHWGCSATLGWTTQPFQGWKPKRPGPRVAADGNPGLDDATPLGLKLRTQNSTFPGLDDATPSGLKLRIQNSTFPGLDDATPSGLKLRTQNSTFAGLDDATASGLTAP